MCAGGRLVMVDGLLAGYFLRGDTMKYPDRPDAGRCLAGKLRHLKDRQPIILTLPRGGVAIGLEIARSLDAPLDIVLVRKIGVPRQPELALGAVTDGAAPETFIDRDLAIVLAAEQTRGMLSLPGPSLPQSVLQTAPARRDLELRLRQTVQCHTRQGCSRDCRRRMDLGSNLR